MYSDGLTIILIRHAEPVRPEDGKLAEGERPLTERGHRDAAELARVLSGVPAQAVVSSPYLRAIQTVTPLARQLGIAVEVIDDLRERLLSPEDNLRDWKKHLERTWREFDYALPGGESSAVAQTRAMAVLAELSRRYRSGTLVAGSHGNLISLALNAIRPEVNFDFWAAMPMPAVYRLEFSGGRFAVIEGPGF
jgi:2,3-bisphosphoglycerate-dependent phosphoglycerate mutase